MNVTSRVKLLVALLAALAGGCVSVPKEAGFGTVEAAVTERTAMRVHWNQGTPEDQAVAASVREMLREPLVPETAVQIALLNNRGLQATYEELGVAQAALVQAGLLSNPFFDAAVRFPVAGGPVAAEITLVQDFLDIFYIPMRKQVAASDFEATKLRVAGAVLDHVAETEAAWYRLVADEQMREMREQVVEAMEASYDATKRLREAGNVRRLDVDTERALLEQARLDLAAAEVAVLAGRERLNTLMGMWGSAGTEWTTASRLPEVPAESLDLDNIERRAIAASLDLAVARQDLISLGELLGLVKVSSAVPDLEFGVNSEREEGAWGVGPAVALPIPIFHQGQAQIASAEADLRRQQQAYAALAVELRAAARIARQRYVVSRDMARHYGSVMLTLRGRILNETQLEYNAMQVGVFQLLLAKQQQIDTAQRYIESLREYWLARTELEQLLRGRRTNLGAAREEAMAASPASGSAAAH